MNFEPLVLHRGAADWGLPMTHIITRPGADPYDRLANAAIAEIPSIQPYCMGASPADIAYADTQLAYATLFTAAPALLDALEGMIRVFYTEPGTLQEKQAEYMNARKAVATALGQNHPGRKFIVMKMEGKFGVPADQPEQVPA